MMRGGSGGGICVEGWYLYQVLLADQRTGRIIVLTLIVRHISLSLFPRTINMSFLFRSFV